MNFPYTLRIGAVPNTVGAASMSGPFQKMGGTQLYVVLFWQIGATRLLFSPNTVPITHNCYSFAIRVPLGPPFGRCSVPPSAARLTCLYVVAVSVSPGLNPSKYYLEAPS